jgi:hypothetical protein
MSREDQGREDLKPTVEEVLELAILKAGACTVCFSSSTPANCCLFCVSHRYVCLFLRQSGFEQQGDLCTGLLCM